MNLDDLQRFKQLDSQDMQAHINGLPDQLQSAWEISKTQPFEDFEPSKGCVRQIIIAGMGGSAIGADLVSAAVMNICQVPIFVLRDYGLPAFAKGQETLVICSSHSGNTEETLDTFETAVERDCGVLAITTGGKLAESAKKAGIPIWQFEHQGQPRAAVGFSFGLILGVLSRLELVPDMSTDITGAVQAMKTQQAVLKVGSPVSKNPAKRIAGQFVGRWVTIFGADVLAPVARRWKGQINEVAKGVANFEFVPEADHNTLAGLENPEDVIPPKVFTFFLRAASNHPRNKLRMDMTRQQYMLEGMAVDGYTAKGNTPMAQMWTALHFGDYVSYYLAMAYGVDPSPVTALENIKISLRGTNPRGNDV